MGQAEALLVKDSNVNISVRSEAALPRPTPSQEGDRSASRGPWSIFSCPSWETLDNPGIPGLEVWLPFLGLVPWALPPLPRCHTSPHLSSHPTSPQPWPFKDPASRGQGRTEPGGRRALSKGLSRPRGRTKRGVRRRQREARPLPREGRARARPPSPAPAPGAPFAERFTLVAGRTAPQRPGRCAARLP